MPKAKPKAEAAEPTGPDTSVLKASMRILRDQILAGHGIPDLLLTLDAIDAAILGLEC